MDGHASPLRPLEGLSSRRAAYEIHDYLRQLILTGRLPPSMVLSQVEVARELGVSRTPVRESIRMLQEEGLVSAEPNYRARVTGYEAGEIDSIFAERILLECLGAALTVPVVTDHEISVLENSLDRLQSRECRDDFDEWVIEHWRFHLLLVGKLSGETLDRVKGLQEKSSRMHYLYRDPDQVYWWLVGDAGHAEILDAYRSREADRALGLIADHLRETAKGLVAGIDPSYSPVQTETSARLVASASADWAVSSLLEKMDSSVD